MSYIEPHLKLCQGCRFKKLRSLFTPVKSAKEGLSSRCRECVSAREDGYIKKRMEDPAFSSLKVVKLAEYHKKRMEDPIYRTVTSLKRMLNKSFDKRREKSGHPTKDLGCTLSELKAYIEKLMLPGMTWDNRAEGLWHIGHREPLASFDLSRREQFVQAWHYTNLQPLWAKDNFRKGDSVPTDFE